MTVRVKDALGQPLPSFPVIFSIQAGGGKVNGSTNPVQVSTNVNGIAKVEWRLGPNAGQNNNKLRAAAVFNGQDISGSPIDYTASAQVGQAANLAKISGDDQSGVVQDRLAEPFVVRVTDNGGNPVVGWPVDFAVQSGGGNFSGSNSITVTTNSTGLASAILTLGSVAATPSNPFNNRVNVSAANDGPLNGSPVSFKASAVATDASALILIGGSNQTGQAGLALAQTVRVKVADNQQNGISGHPVTMRVTKGGGTINGTSSGDTQKTINTNSQGIVAVTWYLGGTLGGNSQELTITATDGINNLTNSPMTIVASATTGPVDPNVSTVVSDKPQLPADGQSVATITITLKDKFGNVVPGKAVTITSSGSNNDIEQPGDLTDSNGQVHGRISSTRAETKSVSARNISDGINLISSANVKFDAIAADDMEMRGGDGQTANVGTAIESPLEVIILDDNNNPVPGVDVEFVVVTGGGFILDGNALSKSVGGTEIVVTAATGNDGVARGYWVLGTNPGTNLAEVRANGLKGSPIRFTATGIISQPSTIQLHSGHNQSNRVAGSTLPQPLRVRVIDSNGKPVTQVPVEFQVMQGDGELSETSLLTDYRGIASTELALGRKVGTNRVAATSSDLTGSPVTFEFQSVVGPPALILSEVGDGGSGQVGTDFPISVKIADVYENPVSGIHAAFRVIESAATIVSQDNTTSEFGLAVARVNLPTLVGPVVVQATSNQLPGFFKNFEIHAHAGPGSNMADFGGNHQEGTIGRELVYPLAARITDVFGNNVEGHQVQWIVTPANGSALSSSATASDARGIAENRLTLTDNVGQTVVWAIALGKTIEFRASGVTNKFPLFEGLADRSVTEGNELSFQVSATDDDGDPITYEAQNLPQRASFNSGSRTFSWTPATDQSGEYEVTFIARDNKGGLDSETIKINVKNENNPPQISFFQPADLVLALVDEEPIQFSINITDLDNDPLSYSWRANGTLVSTSSQYEFRPTEFTSGTYIITIDVTDGEDTVSMQWRLDAVTSVELASFSATASGFDGVQVSWITAREVDNLGFNVLRSENPNGGFEQLNEEIISGNPSGEYLFVDRNIVSGARYYYLLEDVNLSGVRTQHGPISVEISAPKMFSLSQNFPNPFNPETKIRYELPENREVMVKVFDILGREVRTLVNERVDAGFHEVIWDARDNVGRRVSSGVYYYQIVAGDFREIKKMLLIK
ncbi:Ig-like domain-containing protein [bacterium]|nr:Ig-like domain-containing protein [bacterium]